MHQGRKNVPPGGIFLGANQNGALVLEGDDLSHLSTSNCLLGPLAAKISPKLPNSLRNEN